MPQDNKHLGGKEFVLFRAFIFFRVVTAVVLYFDAIIVIIFSAISDLLKFYCHFVG